MFVALFAAAAVTTVPTAAVPARIIDVDGQKVSVSSTVGVNGDRHLYGGRLADGATFDLYVDPDGRVHGIVDNVIVEFDSPRPRRGS